MAKNNIYTLYVDADLDSKLRQFQSQLKEGERIVAQSTVPLPDGRTKLVITTEVPDRKGRNLLLEEHQK